MNITINITEPNVKRLLRASIAGYRNANDALDNAITSENWAAINGAQGQRELHSHTIALIVNKHIVVEEGVQP